MDKSKSIVALSLLCFLCFGGSAFAVVEDVSCGENYMFDGLKFKDFYPEKVTYFQNDTVKLTYTIANEFGSPLVAGDVKVLVLYRAPYDVDRIEDDDVLDDYIVKKDVSLQSGDKYTGSFEWAIPSRAKPGVYSVNAYFPVKKKFNIAGLTFYTAVPGATTTFEVKGDTYEQILIDKNSTTFNGKRYMFRAPIPMVDANAQISITAKLLNSGKKDVNVVYELYKWDDIEARLDSYTKTETASDTKELNYALSNLPVGVYVARITASSGDMKSILKVRFYYKGALGRFIWLGLGSFPLMNGDASKVGFCLSNSAVDPGDSSVKFNVSGTITVLDESGNKILEEKYTAPLTAAISGKRINFTAGKQLTRATVKADMYDDKGNLMDEVEILYDYAKFLNIEKKFSLSAPETVKDTLAYSVSYADKYKDALSGEAVVYLISPDGKVASLNQDKITGELNGAFDLAGMADGEYTLKAVEPIEHLSDQKTITISSVEEPQVTTTLTEEPTTTLAEPAPEPKTDNTLMIVAVVVIVLAVALFAVKGMKKKT
ncbi:MAG: hypothetical protein WAX07_08295 [Candidatus Altiarchaeia archaeon]